MGQGGSQIIHKAFIEFSDTVFNEEISQVAENHLRDDPHVTDYGDKLRWVILIFFECITHSIQRLRSV